MATYFLDTSAIIKRYFAEQGHAWVVSLYDPTRGHYLNISQAALVEVVATTCRKTREQSITIAERDMLINAFRQDSQNIYSIQIVNKAVYTSAGDLCRSHRLRAYDAVQLVCALRLREKALANRAPAPIFVCADNNLIEIAIAEGLSVENPNNYP